MKKISLLVLLGLSACGPLHNIPDDLTYVEMRLGSGPHPEYVKNVAENVEVIVKTNLNYQAEIIRRNNGGVYIFNICDPDDGDGWMGSSFIERVSDGKYVNLFDGVPDGSAPPYFYHIFFWSYQKGGPGHPAGYDLRTRPRDLCLTFSNSGLGYYNHSNTVRIPKEELIKLFATQPRKPVPEAFR